jgi:hypothetical protein
LCKRFFSGAPVASVGDGAEYPRLQPDVGDSRRLVAQDVTEQLLPLGLF